MNETYNIKTITNWPLYGKLEEFAKNVSIAMEKYWKQQNFTHNVAPRCMLVSVGGRYAKLGHFEQYVVTEGGDKQYKCTSVYCFVDILTGDLLKGTWRAPVKNGVRGNLNDKNLLDKFTIHGPVYKTGGGCYDTVSNYLKLKSAT